MKNLFMLALVLIMTSTFVFAQTETPYAKGKYYGEQTVNVGINGDEEDIANLGKSVEAYISYNIETEEQLMSFFEGYEAGVRKACDDYGLGEEVADAILEGFLEGFTRELEASGLL